MKKKISGVLYNIKQTSKILYYFIMVLVFCFSLNISFHMMSTASTFLNSFGFLLLVGTIAYTIISIFKKTK